MIHLVPVRNQRGAVYLLALTTLLVGIIFALAMLRASGGYFLGENSRQKKRAAVNLAEAGIDYAYWQLHYNGQRLPYSADVTLTSGSFHVDATDDGNRDCSTMVLLATGASGGYSYTIRRVALGMLPYHYGWCENRNLSMDRAVLSSGTMGAIRANGSIALNSNSNNLTTGVWATTTIFARGTVSPRYAGSPPVLYPDIDYAHYWSIADHYYAHSTTFVNLDHLETGMIYVNGDVDVSGWYRGQVTVVATGNIKVTGSLWPADQTSYLALATDHDITVQNAAGSVEAVLYAHSPGGSGDVNLNGSKTLTGSIAADDVSADSSVTLVRDTRLNLYAMKQLRLPGL